MELLPLTTAHLESPMWNSEEEFGLMRGRLQWHLHTPYAHAFCAVLHGTDVRGICSAVRFGTSARITTCKLVQGHDATAVRAALLEKVLDALLAEGCTAFTLTAQPADVPHWEALGFVEQEPLLRYTGGRFVQATRDEVIHLEPYHRMAVMRMDKLATGEDRGTFLWEHNYLGQVYAEGHALRGFSLAMLGHALIVADAPAIGLELQRWIFPTQEHILLPEGNAAADAHLQERGYRAEIMGVRMVRGKALPYRPEQIYAEPFGVV